MWRVHGQHFKPEELAEIVEKKTGIKVVLGTHDYH
jgi:predicted metal-binding protein